MEHVVFYTGQDGSERYRRAAGLEEAVRHVEHLSNAEGVSDCRVYALSEVPLRVKTVYVVEVSEAAAPAPAAPPAAEAASEPAPEPTAAADPMAELTVPAMPEMPEFVPMPVASAPEQPAAPTAPEPSPEAEVVFAAPEPAASNGNGSTPPRSLGFFAR